MRLVLSALAALALAQDVPLPNTPDGWVLQAGVGKGVVVNAFEDFLCSDCAAAFPVLKQLLAHYKNSAVSFVLHSFPLPYHTWAFRCAQGAHVVRSINGTDASVLAYQEMMFDNQGDFFDPSINQTWVDAHIVDLVSTHLGLPAASVAAGMVRPIAGAFSPRSVHCVW